MVKLWVCDINRTFLDIHCFIWVVGGYQPIKNKKIAHPDTRTEQQKFPVPKNDQIIQITSSHIWFKNCNGPV